MDQRCFERKQDDHKDPYWLQSNQAKLPQTNHDLVQKKSPARWDQPEKQEYLWACLKEEKVQELEINAQEWDQWSQKLDWLDHQWVTE